MWHGNDGSKIKPITAILRIRYKGEIMANSTDKSAQSKPDKPLSASRDFEGLKQTNEHGAEYWSARDLQSVLGYSQWRRFEEAVQRAITSCEQSGNPPEHHCRQTDRGW